MSPLHQQRAQTPTPAASTQARAPSAHPVTTTAAPLDGRGSRGRVRILGRMKINTWLKSGFAARGDHSDPSNWIVWFPAVLDNLTDGPLVGESESVPFYLTPKTSALHTTNAHTASTNTTSAHTTSGDIVLLGVPLGDIASNWRLSDRAGVGTDVRFAESLGDAASLIGDDYPHRTDGSAVVQVRGQFPIEAIQVVAGQNRPATKRAKDTLRNVGATFNGERQFHTMPELFPDVTD